MNNTTETPIIEAGERESVLSQRLGLPRSQFNEWRKAGDWRQDEHFTGRGGAGGAREITISGVAHMLILLKLDPEEVPTVKTITLMAICAGAMNRVLRCRPIDGGSMVSVRLTGANSFAAKFRRGDRIEAVPTDVEGIYEYDGGVPRRMRL